MDTLKIPDSLSYQVLKLIDATPNISQRQLANKLGVSLGKTNYCLKALVGAGWVKVGSFAKSNSKMGYAYLLTPKGIKQKAVVTLRFLEKKQQQYEKLKEEIASLRQEVNSAQFEEKDEF